MVQSQLTVSLNIPDWLSWNQIKLDSYFYLQSIDDAVSYIVSTFQSQQKVQSARYKLICRVSPM